eukprot:TRINITY_DN1816_c0_g1_i1.p2 TRINITY_DN1816_c0_g1~~TRINITY_DN1816_c0_g1_i1.p2  ORF type:complete len:227 (-),score=41.87 TRINITY_DN1816_c0_g1_i1:856-1536(-)
MTNKKDFFFKQAKGFYGRSKNVWKIARLRVYKALQYQYISRRLRKRETRSSWIGQIGSATKEHGMSYSVFLHGLSISDVSLNRKMLAELAVNEPSSFYSLVKHVQDLKIDPKANAAEQRKLKEEATQAELRKLQKEGKIELPHLIRIQDRLKEITIQRMKPGDPTLEENEIHALDLRTQNLDLTYEELAAQGPEPELYEPEPETSEPIIAKPPNKKKNQFTLPDKL